MFARAIALPSTWNSRIVPGVISFVFAARANAMVFFSPLSSLRSLCPLRQIPSPSTLAGARISFLSFPFLYFLHFLYLVCLLSRRRTLRHHYSLLELIHHLRLQPHFRRPLRQGHLIDLVLQLQQGEKQPFGPRRASYDIHIHRNDLVHALQHRIRIERSAVA